MPKEQSQSNVQKNKDHYKVDRTKIVIVDDIQVFNQMLTDLLAHKLVAFDVEWKFGETDVSLIQIATINNIFLVDVKKLSTNSSTDWRKLGRQLFNNEEIIKLGFSQDGDMAVLKKSLPQLGTTYDKSNSFIDLKKCWVWMRDFLLCKFPHAQKDDTNNKKEDLQCLVKIVLGKVLQKDQQFSNWSRRPLTDQQIMYAAADAYCLLDVFDVFNKAARKSGFDLTSYDFCKKLK